MILRSMLLVLLAVCTITTAAHGQNTRRPPSGQGMEYGPYLCHSVTFALPKDYNARTWEGAVTRGMAIALPGEKTLCYDIDRLAVAAFWQGGFLDLSKTHHTGPKGSLPPRPGGHVLYQDLRSPGWLVEQAPAEGVFHGYYLHRERVILAYRVGDREVLESPTAEPNSPRFGRLLNLAAGRQPVSLLVAFAVDAEVDQQRMAVRRKGKDGSVLAIVAGQVDGLELRQDDQHRVYLQIPPSAQDRRLAIWMASGGGEPSRLPDGLPRAEVDLRKETQGGPPRWPETVVTQGVRAPDDQAYVFDDLTLPDYPWGSWMRVIALDCFADGRIAIATLNGDVWTLSWDDEKLERLQWRRFATGLYEPLGLRIVKDQIYVRGRDRITRLHDLNRDGEADFYENFHAAGPIGPGYHAFLFDLTTDREGNFYFAVSGRKAPTIGQVVRVSADGKHRETVARHFRHPNGLGSGGPDDWILVADNPDGKFPSGASIVREGGKYGFEGQRTIPMLYVLPPKVDTSSGSQVWSDARRWGPLSNTIIHTSYSTSTLSYVMVQHTGGHPNGFAVHLPFVLKSGVMRARVNPADGQLIVGGLRGWDSSAAADGCLYRIRYTGKPAYLVTAAAAVKKGIRLTFSCPLDESTIDYENFSAARIGEGDREVDVEDVVLIDERTVLVEIDDIDPSAVIDPAATKRWKSTQYRVVDPLAITMNIKAKDGARIKTTVYATINSLPQ